ncbi:MULTISPECIES: DUF445 domain-containing protein [Clostridium]|uniref:DUF445 domain-containing protein n=1 Tax=Clostridium TaxID=1485 RepID=UPI000825FB3C|nr:MULTISPECIES: DUF445 family protein [Clostridium]PJI07152.1 DUF445 domain-containing protein [Clostridium sp. CT7]
MKKSNKYKASSLLTFFGVCYFISSAFKDNFYGGLISSISEAALVGGIADWFGVTAIFKKPLNINWPKKIFRTDILRDNKEKFVCTIVDMVENDLLSKEKINEKVRNYDFFSAILNMKLLKKEVLQNIISRIDIKRFLKDNIYENEAYVNKALDNFIQSKLYDKAVELVIGEMVKVINEDFSIKFINEILTDTIKRYEGNSLRRKLTTGFILKAVFKGNLKLAPYIVKDKIIEKLNSIRSGKNEYKEDVKKFILSIYKNKDKSSFPDVSTLVKDCAKRCENCPKECKIWNKKYSEDNISELIINAVNNLDKKVVNEFISNFIEKLVNSKHKEIGSIVRESLNKYNDDEIIKLAYDKAGDDLQLIRINGSVVGGMVGMLVFIVTKILI